MLQRLGNGPSSPGVNKISPQSDLMTKTWSWIGQGCADFVAMEIISDQLVVHQP
jgi:hypothetical protein